MSTGPEGPPSDRRPGWTAVIGVEVHVQLASARKLFCACRVAYDAPPGSHVCPTCRAFPGTLPVLDAEAVELAVRAAVALGADVQAESRFDRKHYAYADLPKGFQLTQASLPLAHGGAVHARVDGALRRFRLARIHLEEDSARTLEHGVDDNRAGVPLIEVVTTPELQAPEEAEAFLRALHRTLRAAGVCHGDLERGQLRCDANVSLRHADGRVGARVEIKNLNSFRFVTRALRHELARQSALLDAGQDVAPETRGWDGHRTYALRPKASAYRVLPEPDLPPILPTASALRSARAALPGAPLDLHLDSLDQARLDDWRARYSLTDAEAGTLARSVDIADFFERSVAAGCEVRAAIGWIRSEVLRRANDGDGTLSEALGHLAPHHLRDVQALLDTGTINRDGAKALFEALSAHGGDAAAHVTALGLTSVRDAHALRPLVDDVLARHPRELQRARAGDRSVHGFFVGQVMRATGRRADPLAVARLLSEAIDGPPGDGGSS